MVRELLADLETPLSCYLKLANPPYSYLLESVQGGEKWGRYSFIGLPCRTVLACYVMQHHLPSPVTVIALPKQHHVAIHSLLSVTSQQTLSTYPYWTVLPRFTGGLVGYFGYDTLRYVEPRLKVPANLYMTREYT